MSLKLGGTDLNGNKLKCIIGIHGHWKNQNPGGRFGATSQTALPIQPIWPIFLVDRLNWQCCLAGSSKMAPRMLIFSMAMGANYSLELIFNETCTPQFNGHNNSFLASVNYGTYPFNTNQKKYYNFERNEDRATVFLKWQGCHPKSL